MARVSGKRYGQAIFELALDQGDPEQWGGDLEVITEVFQDAEFTSLLKQASVSSVDKRQAVETVLAGVRPLVRNMVHLLVSRGLADAIPDACEEYGVLLDRRLGRQRVEITTAVPLSPEETERITNFIANLAQREVVVTARVDEDILGGLVIQIGDRLLDGSTQARLNALRGQLNVGVR